jgi:hypothetical protein
MLRPKEDIVSGNVRFSWHRPGGWGRLGLAASVAVTFLTPMLWSLGAFGTGDDSLRRALIFLFAGLWLGISVGYTLGWAMRGFFVRTKESDDDDESPAQHRPSAPPAAHPSPGRHSRP